jgi:large subunit ribosomal protein L31|tara:strand:- start:393 stop:830 length:438 start_codon:yes stop_codon:yes gene_type:complete
MRKEIHPEYREVLFHDTSVDEYFLIRSTLNTDQTKEYEGKTYPYCVLDISSASHPFYTGKQKFVNEGGRVDKFKKRFGNRTKVAAAVEEAPVEEVIATEAVAEEAVAVEAPVEEVVTEEAVAAETATEEAVVEEATEEESPSEEK